MPDLNQFRLPELYAHLSRGGLVRRLVELARDEDLGPGGDVTSIATVPESAVGEAAVVARSAGVVCGMAAVQDLFTAFGVTLGVADAVPDGARVEKSDRIGIVRGRKRDILLVERTLVNLIGRLSGVATRAATFVDALGTGVRARLYDTRKSTPGLRVLEKYAVRCGGAMCHRLGLWDAVLIKDNHLAGVALGDLAGFVAAAVRRARQTAAAGGVALAFIEVEADSLKQLERLLTVEPGLIGVILLDNMSPHELRQAVAARDAAASPVQLEASGGVRLESVRLIAETGVDRISAGTLTHGAAWMDVALDMITG
ncbi:MAG: carboxylating nicotinate-nucleotide diphosphorylase [Phycisphaerales bacterium]